jgi:hypothetical protein
LWKWRKKSDLSLDDVREAVNDHLGSKHQLNSRSAIHNYEHRNQPPLRFLIALKKAYPYDVDVNWILFGDDRPWEREPHGYSEREIQGLGEEADAAVERAKRRAPLGPRGDWLLSWFFSNLAFRDPRYDDPETLDELDRWFVEWAEAPSRLSGHFVPMKALNSAEAETYCYALLAAIRPLLRVVRDDKSRHLMVGGAWIPEWFVRERTEEDPGALDRNEEEVEE